MFKKNNGFTLIELVVVIAIIGILCSFITSSITSARISALTAKTKIQFEKYANAINLYYIEYGQLPAFIQAEQQFNLNWGNNSELFIKTMACHDLNGQKLSNDDKQLNQNNIVFCEFYDDDFLKNENGSINKNYLADTFNNSNIIIIVKNKYDNSTTIPQSCFNGKVKDLIPASGLHKQVAIYSINSNNRKIICNWRTK